MEAGAPDLQGREVGARRGGTTWPFPDHLILPEIPERYPTKMLKFPHHWWRMLSILCRDIM